MGAANSSLFSPLPANRPIIWRAGTLRQVPMTSRETSDLLMLGILRVSEKYDPDKANSPRPGTLSRASGCVEPDARPLPSGH